MWYYTKEFDDVTDDPPLYMEDLINHANTAYQNSNINLRLETLCVEKLEDTFKETDSDGADKDVTTLLNDFVGAKGSATNLRQTADLAFLVTSTYRGGACGAVSTLP